MASLGQSFAPGVSDSLWNYQDDLLTAMVEGLLQNPVISGVVVEKDQGGIVVSAGRSSYPPASWMAFLPPYQDHVVLLEHEVGGNMATIGRMTLFSDSEITVARLFTSFRTSATVAAVNAILLWLLFYIVITRTISRPLARLSRQVADDADRVGMPPLTYRGEDEIGVLVAALNDMRTRLAASHRELEAKVDERTQALQKLAEEFQALSNRDALTGCLNRRNMEERLTEEIARSRRYGLDFSLVLCDIDHFKKINDSFGHATGDRVLCDFAWLLKDGVRHDIDWVVRFGGEEFLVVLPETPLEGARRLMERLRQSFSERTMNQGGIAFHVTASFGVVSQGSHASGTGDAAALLAAADRELYRAKESGRNRVSAAPLP